MKCRHWLATHLVELIVEPELTGTELPESLAGISELWSKKNIRGWDTSQCQTIASKKMDYDKWNWITGSKEREKGSAATGIDQSC